MDTPGSPTRPSPLITYKVSIPCYTIKNVNGKDTAFFKVTVQYLNDIWDVEHRFSEFHLLNDTLSSRMLNLPTIPSKLAGFLYF